MRILVSALVVLVFAACGSGGGSGDGPDGSSPDSCRDLANQICQQAAGCSAAGDAGVVFILGGYDAGTVVVNAYDLTVNSESGCEGLIGLACKGDHAAAFTTNCSAPIKSGLQCGPSTNHHGNGLVVPAPCAQSL